MRLFLLALGLAMGFAMLMWAASCQFGGLSLDLQIKPVDVATLAVSIFIAFFLQYYLASRATDSRAEKDLLIDYVSEVIRDLRSCRDAVSAFGEPEKITGVISRKILKKFRQLSNNLENLATVLKESDCRKLAGRCEDLKINYLSYKMAATGGNFPSQLYTRTQRSDQERSFRELNSTLQRLIFDVNRYR